MTVTDNGARTRVRGRFDPSSVREAIEPMRNLHDASAAPGLYNCGLIPNYLREPRRTVGRPMRTPAAAPAIRPRSAFYGIRPCPQPNTPKS